MESRWDGKKKKSGGSSGWPHKNGDNWVPTDHKGTHDPHWDVQHPDGTHTPTYPESDAYNDIFNYDGIHYYDNNKDSLPPGYINSPYGPIPLT